MSKRLDTFEKMIEQGSEDPFVHYARAMELRSLERLEEALLAYQDVATRFPDYVATYLMAGQTAEALGRVADARSWYARGVTVAEKMGDGHARAELTAALEAL